MFHFAVSKLTRSASSFLRRSRGRGRHHGRGGGCRGRDGLRRLDRHGGGFIVGGVLADAAHLVVRRFLGAHFPDAGQRELLRALGLLIRAHHDRLDVLPAPLQHGALSGSDRVRLRDETAGRDLLLVFADLKRLEQGVDGLLRLQPFGSRLLAGLARFPGLGALEPGMVEIGLRDGVFLRRAFLRALRFRHLEHRLDVVEPVFLVLLELPHLAATGHQESRDKDRQEKDQVPVPHFAPPLVDCRAFAE